MSHSPMHVYVSRLIPYGATQKKSHLPSPRLEHPLRGWHLGSQCSFSTTRIITVVSLILLHGAYATIRKAGYIHTYIHT